MFNSYIDKITRKLLTSLDPWFTGSGLPYRQSPVTKRVIRSLLATRFAEDDFNLHSIIKHILEATFPELSDGTLYQYTVEIYNTYLLSNRNALHRLLEHASKWIHYIKILDQILKAALFIVQAVWFFVKEVPLPGSNESDKNIDPTEAHEIQKSKIKANKWIASGLLISILVNILHFIVLKKLSFIHGRIYALILISALSTASIVVLCIAAVMHGDFWDILGSEGPLLIDCLILALMAIVQNICCCCCY